MSSHLYPQHLMQVSSIPVVGNVGGHLAVSEQLRDFGLAPLPLCYVFLQVGVLRLLRPIPRLV